MTQVPPIPLPLKEYALDQGLKELQVRRLWAKHVRGSHAKGYDAGGIAWRRYVDAAAANVDDDLVELDDHEKTLEARRAVEQRAKDAEDAVYLKEAVTLETYLASLLMKPRETRTAAEEVLMGARNPDAKEELWSYMHRAFSPQERARQLAAAERDGTDPPPRAEMRVRLCGCGQPVKTWNGWMGRQYWGAECVRCAPPKQQGERGKDGAR